LIWKVSSPSGGYGRNTNQASAVITMLASRLAEMERQIRRDIAGAPTGDVDASLDEAEDAERRRAASTEKCQNPRLADFRQPLVHVGYGVRELDEGFAKGARSRIPSTVWRPGA
jgi:hypothetical protein